MKKNKKFGINIKISILQGRSLSVIAAATFVAFFIIFLSTLIQTQENGQSSLAKTKDEIVVTFNKDYGIRKLGASKDPYTNAQWAIMNPGSYTFISDIQSYQKPSALDVDLDVPEAWDYMKKEGINRREVIVALIDTGVDISHPDLAGHIWTNTAEIPDDGIDNDNNGYIDDVNGWDFYNNDNTVYHKKYNEAYQMELADPEDSDDHGTHIAGIIAAIADNEIGIAGIAANIDVKLMILKINGGPDGTGSITSAIEAIKYATMMGADICNLSWGTNQYSATLKEVMKESDMLFVAAAGNTGTNNNSSPVYPASMEISNLISVTFINPSGTLTKYSNYGATTVNLAAPGEDIISTVVGSYAFMSGSSMAAPHVSAIAALLYSYQEKLYASNIKEILLNAVKPLPGLDGYVKNAGIISAFEAVKASESLVWDLDPPEIKLNTVYEKEKFKIPVEVIDRGGSDVRVVKWITGEKTLEDFKRGIAGSLVVDNEVTILKAGKYTFYASDYAGNEIIKTYEVMDDATPPSLSYIYTVSADYKKRTVTVKVSDSHSNVRRVKYMEGKKKASDFLPAGAGTELMLKDGKAVFDIKKDGTYSIYAIDYRGNTIVKQVEIKTIKAGSVKFTRSQKTMLAGDKYTLSAFVKPADSTDKITYTSSDEKVASVSSSGKVTAIKEGKAIITARSSSGKKAVCEITVKN